MINNKKGILKDIPRPGKKVAKTEEIEANTGFNEKSQIKDGWKEAAEGFSKIFKGVSGVVQKGVADLVKEGQQTVRKISDQVSADRAGQNSQKKTDEIQKPGEVLAEEIKNAGEHYLHMLELTWLFLYNKEKMYKDFSAEQIQEKWIYALGSGETPLMQKRYQKICEDADLSEGESLERWMKYLEKAGFSRMFSGEEEIVLSDENRSFFANSKLFKDRAAVGIDVNPWMYRHHLARQGTLVQEETEEQVIE